MTKEENISTLNEHLDHWKRLLSEKICDQDEGEKTIDALQNAIKALEQEPCEDAISRQAVIDTIDKWIKSMHVLIAFPANEVTPLFESVHELPSVSPQPKMGSSSENPNKWIPITSRPMTEEEKEHYKTHPEYQDDYRIFNCKLPDDGQEVLISVCGGVEVDTFVQDANDGCYFEGRDIDDVDAWMPLPEPYKQEVEG